MTSPVVSWHALPDAQRDTDDATAVLGDADAEAAVDRDREVGAGQVVQQPRHPGEESVRREDGGIERAVVLEHDAAQQLVDRLGADGHGEQVLHLVLGERDRGGQCRHHLGQRAGDCGRVGVGWRGVLEHDELHGRGVEQPLRGEPAAAVQVESELDPPAPGGRGPGEDGQYRPQLDRAGGDRRRPDDDGEVVEAARGERERGVDLVHRGQSGDLGGDLEPEGVGLPREHDRTYRDLERLADGLHVDAGGQRVVEGLAQRRQGGGKLVAGGRFEAADRIGGEVDEQVVGELGRAVAQREEVTDLGDQLADGAGEVVARLGGELVQQEGQGMVGGVDRSRGGRGGQPRSSRVEHDVGAGLGTEEDPKAAVQRRVHRLAPWPGTDHAEAEVEAEGRRAGTRDVHGCLQAGRQPAERRGSRRGELRGVDEGTQLERSGRVVAGQRDPRREHELAGLARESEDRLQRVEKREEARRLPTERAGVAQPAGRVVQEAERQAHRRLGRLVEQAERAEDGVDDRLGRLVGAAKHLQRRFAEQRRRELEEGVDGRLGVEVGPDRDVPGGGGAGRSPAQHGPGRVEVQPGRAGRRGVVVRADAGRPAGGGRSERHVGGPAEAALAGRRIDRERAGVQIGGHGDRAGDEADRRGVVARGRESGAQQRSCSRGEPLPAHGIAQRAGDERAWIVHELLDRVGHAAVGGQQLEGLERRRAARRRSARAPPRWLRR